MNDKKHATINFPADRGDFLDWATSEDDGCISVGGLAIRCGLMGTGAVEPEPPAQLSPAEREAYEEFMKVLAE